ncbi:MAG: glycosyltransferase family 4 protein [Bacteroidota bacterium]|nr:glycosyltransferase family 4 protein [Bacteroidota bacterium]
MKIVLLGTYNPSEILTGPEKFAKRLFHELIDKNIEITFITYYQDGKIYSINRKLFGKEIISNHGSRKVYRMGIFPLLYFFLFTTYDLIHLVTFERFSIIALFCAKIRKLKTVYTVHSILKMEYNKFAIPYSLKTKLLDLFCEKMYFRYVNKLLFVSELVHQWGKDYNFVVKEGNVIHNGADKVFFATKRSSDNNNISIVFSGNIQREEKGFSYFKECIATLNLPTDIFIISSTSTPLNLPKHLRSFFVEPMSSDVLAEFLSNKDIFFSASEYDTFSIATLEAMAAGCIPIVTSSTGIASLIRNGINGFVVEYGDITSAADNIVRVAEDSKLWDTLSHEARTTVQDMKWHNTAANYSVMYDRKNDD